MKIQQLEKNAAASRPSNPGRPAPPPPSDFMSRYLDMVDGPAHVRKMTVEQMTKLAAELREELITKLAKNGGHLGPNLGVVELTLALHHTFATPRDKFVWTSATKVTCTSSSPDGKIAFTPSAPPAA